MSDDDTPSEPREAPSEASSPAPPEPAVAPDETAAPTPAASSPGKRRGIYVPPWVAIVVVALVLLVAGFALGRIVGSGGEHHDRGERPGQEFKGQGGQDQTGQNDSSR